MTKKFEIVYRDPADLIPYEMNAKKHDEQSKDVQKYYNLIRFTSYGQVVIFIGFMMILMVMMHY